jgi:acyl-CoA thioester hydrolase
MHPLFTHRLEVRFRDCDPLGHVNNAVYLTYLEQARFALWRTLWGFPEASRPGVIMARSEVDYKIPARYGDQLEIRLFLATIGRTSFTYSYEVVDDAGRIVAAATTVQVMYDYKTEKPVPISDEIRAKLEQQV